MNITSRTRGIFAASLVFVGLAASVSQAQTISVNGTNCPAATVTMGAGTININTGGCGGTGGTASAPTISGLSVSTGFRGDSVTINGANLSGAGVTIGGAAATVTNNTGTQIFTTVPAAATDGAGSVVVTTTVAPAATAGFTISPTVLSPPVITGVNPATGTPGSAFTITGSNLSGATLVVCDVAATGTISSTSITTSIPAAAAVGACSITVTTDTSPAATTSITVLAPPPPSITGVAPASGAPLSLVTITGAGLAGGTVTIGGIAAAVTTSSSTSITATVPASAALGATTVVVTTSVAPAASSAFTVTAAVVGDVSIEGITLPNPSKQAFVFGPGHAGANGAGNEVNAYAMQPTRCATTPALTRSWQHNIDLADYKGKNAFDFFVLQANESLSYKFTVGQVDASGGFIYNDAANAVVRPTFISITTAPCDFNIAKLEVGPNRDSCYQTGLNGNSVNWANITGTLPAAYCRLVKGQTYYMNLRFQDARPASQGGSPTTDSCTSGNCGGIIQAL